MENEAMMGDTLRKTDSPEREMINRDKHGAVVELAVKGTPKKAIARMLGVGIKSVRRILTFIERVVSGCVDAEFAAYAALPEINTDEINRWFWIDGPAYREILNLLVRHKERGWVLSNNLNPSTKRLIDIRVKTVEAEEAVVHTTEYWYLRWWDTKKLSYVYPYRETNRQTYIVKQKNGTWNVFKNLRPSPRSSAPNRRTKSSFSKG